MLSSTGVPRRARYILFGAVVSLVLFLSWSRSPATPTSLLDAPQTPAPGASANDRSPKTPQTASGASGKNGDSDAPSKLEDTLVDWTRFAYVNYVTSEEQVCQAVMIMESLYRLGARADRLLLYPESWKNEIERGGSALRWNKELLVTAAKKYQVKLKPVHIPMKDEADPIWTAGFMKLLAYNQTAYDRVLSLDSDANVLQPMDELFFLPETPLAALRAYWLIPEGKKLWSAQIFVAKPSSFEWSRVEKALESKGSEDYAMGILNKLYGADCMVIPHRPYYILSGEFKKGKNGTHREYLGSSTEKWDAKKILNEAKYLHFRDGPLVKPWYENKKEVFEKEGPKCIGLDDPDCVDKMIWKGLYTDYAKRRKDICKLDLIRLPET